MLGIMLCVRVRSLVLFFIVLITLNLVGCGSFLSSSGPSAGKFEHHNDIQIIELNHIVVSQLARSQKQHLFSEAFVTPLQTENVLGAGDVIEVSIWEITPALFSGVMINQPTGSSATRVTTFPEQMVSNEGTINIPFAGQIPVSGRSCQQIESEIMLRLQGKANQPQVLVRTVRNNTTNVTIAGEVTSSTRMPLTAKRERLLDALAAAGGVRQPVNKMTLQLTRGNLVLAMPLDLIIRDPKQNITLQPDDVITLLFQPLSFTALGATGKNEEVNFETQGVSLVQALARVGGLQDSRSDIQGVFVFRFESANVLGNKVQDVSFVAGSTIPVIYRVNLQDPATFFAAQNFLMKNKDILYVSNAPAADFQKFLNMVVSVVYPVVNVINTIPSRF